MANYIQFKSEMEIRNLSFIRIWVCGFCHVPNVPSRTHQNSSALYLPETDTGQRGRAKTHRGSRNFETFFCVALPKCTCRAGSKNKMQQGKIKWNRIAHKLGIRQRVCRNASLERNACRNDFLVRYFRFECVEFNRLKGDSLGCSAGVGVVVVVYAVVVRGCMSALCSDLYQFCGRWGGIEGPNGLRIQSHLQKTTENTNTAPPPPPIIPFIILERQKITEKCPPRFFVTRLDWLGPSSNSHGTTGEVGDKRRRNENGQHLDLTK